MRAACLEKGFFQLTNHGISVEWQDAVLEQARQFFALPLEQKMEISLSECLPEVTIGPCSVEEVG